MEAERRRAAAGEFRATLLIDFHAVLGELRLSTRGILFETGQLGNHRQPALALRFPPNHRISQRNTSCPIGVPRAIIRIAIHPHKIEQCLALRIGKVAFYFFHGFGSYSFSYPLQSQGQYGIEAVVDPYNMIVDNR